ncbi:tRNA (adenosine(37)-N6)-threonylcarbamoyltransferase complex ATPase subunit type 1 TsaE [Balneolales bacterium ANBcel1]|nr:tRNA (adenosine(37)-N6)-threonylcarbamoyltransferase complex ATPase subunit type 1 TsaE [Balneolales bacterium ANBcel1]
MTEAEKKSSTINRKSESVGETTAAGQRLAEKLAPGDTVLLKGDLGAGKTHFVKGVARYFGVPEDEVQSPTFALVHEYPGSVPLYHLDCYRLNDADQAGQIGLDEYLYGDGICLIEWPEKIDSRLPDQYWVVEIRHINENTRDISIHRSL